MTPNRSGPPASRCDEPVPSWVSDGSWYSNNPHRQQLAVARWKTMPVTTLEEREAAHAFSLMRDLEPPTFACTSCGKFAFEKPRLCFWCTKTESVAPADAIAVLDRTAKILDSIARTKDGPTSIACPECGGVLRFAFVGPKQHMRAKCDTPNCIQVIQ